MAKRAVFIIAILLGLSAWCGSGALAQMPPEEGVKVRELPLARTTLGIRDESVQRHAGSHQRVRHRRRFAPGAWPDDRRSGQRIRDSAGPQADLHGRHLLLAGRARRSH